MASTADIRERITSYLTDLSLKFEPVGEAIWLIRDLDRGLAHVIVYGEENLVTMRAKVMPVPEEPVPGFFEDLLRLNAEMLHGAYALEDDAVIWIDTLEFDTMDIEEFQSSLDAASVSVMRHVPRLSQYLRGGNNGNV